MDNTRWCAACAEVTAYVTFDCTDHPEDCVELVCEVCGTGLELAPVQVVRAAAAARTAKGGARRTA